MAFCSKCGAQQVDGARFCGKCGQVSGGNAPTVQVMERPEAGDIGQMDRQALLRTFTEARRVLTVYEACRDEADEVKQEALGEEIREHVGTDNLGILFAKKATKEEIERRNQELRKLYPKEAKNVRNSLIIAPVGLVAGVAGIILTLSIQFSMPLLLLSLIIIIGPYWYMSSTSKTWKELEKAYAAGVVESSAEVLVQNNKVDMALTACERSLALNAVPPAYRYTYALEQMAYFIENLLADSWKECAVLYEDHMHKMRMEAHAEETQRLTELNAFYLKQARNSAGAAALFSGLNFFFG